MSAGLRLGRRDLAQGIGGLWLLLACLTVAVAGLAAVTSLSSAISSTIDGQARELLGGDLALSVAQREPTVEERAAIARLGTVRESITLRSTAQVNGQTALVDLSGIDEGWPAAGKVTLSAGRMPRGGGEVAIGRELAERYSLRLGSPVRLGFADLRVSGIIEALPAPSGFALAPPVLVGKAGLDATRLVQPGSLYTTTYRIALPTGAESEAIGEAFQQRFPEGGWRVTDKGDAAAGTRRFTDRTGQMLLLIALGALGIGSIGIASAAGAFAASRRSTIAILKVHGAGRRDLLVMLGTSVAILAATAILLGLLIGATVPAIVGRAAADLLPVAPDPSPQWGALGQSAVFGLLVTIAAAWTPLARAARARPASVLRGDVEERGAGIRDLLVPLIAAAAVAALAILTSGDAVVTAFTIAGGLILAFLFAGAGWLLARTARAIGGRGGPLTRLGLAALHRPGAATVRLSVALGLGLALLVALAGIGGSVRAELGGNIPTKAPALFMLDIPASEETRFRALGQRHLPGAELRLVPSLRGPVTALNGQPVSALKSIPEGAWILRGDRGLTFAGELPPGNEVVEGQWWPANYSGPPLVSLDIEAARALNLKIGDTMTIAVLGSPIEARIASFRTIDWRSFGFNFAIIFAPGTLEQAPYTLMATAAPEQGTSTLAFERALAAELPMVSTIRVSDVVERVTTILEGLDSAIRLATLVAILIGVTVLAGAVAATRRTRARESVLLKLVGATRGQVLTAQGIEFASMSGGIVLLAFLTGSAAAWAVVTQLFELPFRPDWPSLLLLPIAGMAVSILTALAAAWPALKARPATALRSV
ncbi:FtsX-like permease family protein [Sphingomonas sp. LHG3406-1]|uniref:ABC transporter permease n=1 Tax=Sphingomonas sp. LHG3406-1 TaxID=2804617 RepID=UPI0026313A7E|nr:FtsX-like permease family protein [Sphingomonas sp. LHG3406-1]